MAPSLQQNGTPPRITSKKIPPLVPRRDHKSVIPPVEPPPETPELQAPVAASLIQFAPPVKRILSPLDHATFLQSPTYTLIQSWIFTLADCVKGKPTSSFDTTHLSSTMSQVDTVLARIEDLVSRFPAHDTGSRFGNPAFRDFHAALIANAQSLHIETLQIDQPDAVSDVAVYLQNAFGSAERLDYGSGHELNFMMWLLCLYLLGRIQPSDFPLLTLHTFPRYLELMRKIQSMYYLEPAGSHGVWGLDDYQFLPFLFGASQLIGHPYITPKAVHNSVVLDEEGDWYLYLNQVRWVDSVKTVRGLRWHSPMLDDISGAKSWQKVEDGMKKMFVKEVLGKLPIMQHFLFGGLIPAAEAMGRRDPEDERAQAERMRHVKEQGHEPDYWGDCCGIKVPSTIAAGEEMKKRLGTAGGLRPIPFD